MKKNVQYIFASFLVLQTMMFAACSEDLEADDVAARGAGISVPFSATADQRGLSGVMSEVTIGDDGSVVGDESSMTRGATAINKTWQVQAGDILRVTGKDISGELMYTDDGKFDGELKYTGQGTPEPGLQLNGVLLSKNNAMTFVTYDKHTGFPRTAIAGSLEEAVEKYSHLTATTTYGERNFKLSQHTAFLKFTVIMPEGTKAGEKAAVGFWFNRVPCRTGSVITEKADGNVVASFVIPMADGKETKGMSVSVNYAIDIPISNMTLKGGVIYNVTKSNFDVVKIDIPSAALLAEKYGQTDDKESPATLVYEVYNNKNKVCALLCSEYIPEINNTVRVLTLYPVVNGKPNLERGRYLGDCALHKACDIEWKDGKVICSNVSTRSGKEQTVYYNAASGKFCSQFDYQLPEKVASASTIKGKFLAAQKVNSDVSCTLGLGYRDYVNAGFAKCYEVRYDESWIQKLKYHDHLYPLVKIGSRIWTREDFSGNIPHGHDYKHRHGIHVVDGKVYYTRSGAQALTSPKGFHLATMDDFKDMRSVVLKPRARGRSISGILDTKDITGFEMQLNGWYTYIRDVDYGFIKSFTRYFWSGPINGRMLYFAKDCFADISPDNFYLHTTNEEWAMQVRLVMDM